MSVLGKLEAGLHRAADRLQGLGNRLHQEPAPQGPRDGVDLSGGWQQAAAQVSSRLAGRVAGGSVPGLQFIPSSGASHAAETVDHRPLQELKATLPGGTQVTAQEVPQGNWVQTTARDAAGHSLVAAPAHNLQTGAPEVHVLNANGSVTALDLSSMQTRDLGTSTAGPLRMAAQGWVHTPPPANAPGQPAPSGLQGIVADSSRSLTTPQGVQVHSVRGTDGHLDQVTMTEFRLPDQSLIQVRQRDLPYGRQGDPQVQAWDAHGKPMSAESPYDPHGQPRVQLTTGGGQHVELNLRNDHFMGGDGLGELGLTSAAPGTVSALSTSGPNGDTSGITGDGVAFTRSQRNGVGGGLDADTAYRLPGGIQIDLNEHAGVDGSTTVVGAKNAQGQPLSARMDHDFLSGQPEVRVRLEGGDTLHLRLGDHKMSREKDGGWTTAMPLPTGNDLMAAERFVTDGVKARYNHPQVAGRDDGTTMVGEPERGRMMTRIDPDGSQHPFHANLPNFPGTGEPDGGNMFFNGEGNLVVAGHTGFHILDPKTGEVLQTLQH